MDCIPVSLGGVSSPLFLFPGVNVLQEMGKNEFARTLTGSDSGYGDDVSDRNSISSLHPLCKLIHIPLSRDVPCANFDQLGKDIK